jgi:hypothetical protein
VHLDAFRVTHSPASQWVTDTDWNTSRLPPLGPPTLSSLPTLVLITQNLHVQLFCVRSTPQESKVTTISCSLEKHEARDMGGTTNLDSSAGFPTRSCTHAAIGLGYNGSVNPFYFELNR